MLYTFSITAPANTSKTSPATAEMKLKAGYVTRISILIPDGHHALAHLAIKWGETQIIPWGDDEWIEGNDESIPWEENIELPYEPISWTAKAWNEDDTYSHTFYIRIWVEKEPRNPPVDLVTSAFKLIKTFLERIVGVK